MTEPRTGQSSRVFRQGQGQPDSASRMSMVDQWIGRRLEEVQRASAGVDQRIDLLRQAESRVLQLIETLRVEARSAEPMARKLETMTRDTEGQVARAIAAAEAQLPQLAQTVAQQIASCRAACQSVTQEFEQARSTCTESLVPLTEQSQQIIQSAQEQLSALLQPTLDQFVIDAGTRIDEQLADKLSGLRQEIQAAADEAKAHVSQEIQASAKASAQAFSTQLVEQLKTHQQQLEVLLSQGRSLLEDSLEEMRQAVDVAKADGEECLQKIRAFHGGTFADLEQHRHALEKMVTRRAEDSERSGEAFIEQMEGRLTERLRGAKGTIQSQLEATNRDLRSQAQSLSEQASAQVREELTRMQSEADSQLAWIEQRIQQRVDRIIETARTQASGQMLQLEAASQLLRTRAAEPPTSGPVEVSVHVPNARFVNARPVDTADAA